MLRVLEEEQNAQNQREDMLRKVQEITQKKRLQKIFGMERAKAQSRIQKLSDKHDGEVK